MADARGRSDFYIHNSHKGYTHGCIEVSDSFFTKLKEIREKYSHVTHLTVRVHYSDIHTDMHGEPTRPSDRDCRPSARRDRRAIRSGSVLRRAQLFPPFNSCESREGLLRGSPGKASRGQARF